MSNISATRRASWASAALQHPALGLRVSSGTLGHEVSGVSSCWPWRMNTPMTSWPWSRNSQAATLLSTPPDIAKTTRDIDSNPERITQRDRRETAPLAVYRPTAGGERGRHRSELVPAANRARRESIDGASQSLGRDCYPPFPSLCVRYNIIDVIRATTPLGRSLMNRELTDRAEAIQQRILQLRDSL